MGTVELVVYSVQCPDQHTAQLEPARHQAHSRETSVRILRSVSVRILRRVIVRILSRVSVRILSRVSVRILTVVINSVTGRGDQTGYVAHKLLLSGIRPPAWSMSPCQDCESCQK